MEEIVKISMPITTDKSPLAIKLEKQIFHSFNPIDFEPPIEIKECGLSP